MLVNYITGEAEVFDLIKWLFFFSLLPPTIMVSLSNWLLLNFDWYSLVGQHCARILKTSPLSHHFFSTPLIHSCFPQNTKEDLFTLPDSIPLQACSRSILFIKFPTAFAISGSESSCTFSCKWITFVYWGMCIHISLEPKILLLQPFHNLTHSIWPSVPSKLMLESGYFPWFNISETQEKKKKKHLALASVLVVQLPLHLGSHLSD